MDGHFYEGVIEKECMNQIMIANSGYNVDFIRSNIYLTASFRNNPKHPNVLLYDITITDKTRDDKSPRKVTARISPIGFRYELSAHYKGSNQFGPYISGKEGTNKDSIEDACHYIAHSLFSFYQLKDNGSEFVHNKHFKM